MLIGIAQLSGIVWLVNLRIVGDKASAGASIRNLRYIRAIPDIVSVDRQMCRRSPSRVRVCFCCTVATKNSKARLTWNITLAGSVHTDGSITGIAVG
jgi:hypothetical protein